MSINHVNLINKLCRRDNEEDTSDLLFILLDNYFTYLMIHEMISSDSKIEDVVSMDHSSGNLYFTIKFRSINLLDSFIEKYNDSEVGSNNRSRVVHIDQSERRKKLLIVSFE